jgi:hypothetical protein
MRGSEEKRERGEKRGGEEKERDELSLESEKDGDE